MNFKFLILKDVQYVLKLKDVDQRNVWIDPNKLKGNSKLERKVVWTNWKHFNDREWELCEIHTVNVSNGDSGLKTKRLTNRIIFEVDKLQRELLRMIIDQGSMTDPLIELFNRTSQTVICIFNERMYHCQQTRLRQPSAYYTGQSIRQLIGERPRISLTELT